jgi:hypothetical protein
MRQEAISIGDNIMCSKAEHVFHYPKRFLLRALDTSLFRHPSRLGDHLAECRLNG